MSAANREILLAGAGDEGRIEESGLFGFPEERAPCGAAGALGWLANLVGPYRAPPARLEACLAARVAGRPWFIVIWEPLPTAAPGPRFSRPFCCYIQTVIFYVRGSAGGYVVAAEGGSFAEHDRVEHELTFDDVLTFEGELFVLEGGRVCWRRDGAGVERWFMCRLARRVHAADDALRERIRAAAAKAAARART